MSTKTIITIARQYGSGGREIGEKVASKLGIPFYDRELITLAAKQSGMSPEIFEKADEKATNSLLYSLMMGNYTFGSQVTPMNNLPINDKLFLAQSDIIRDIAEKGPCVIVGRCADYVLRENKNCLHVFIYADHFARMDRIIKNMTLIRPRRQIRLSNRISSAPITIIFIPTKSGAVRRTTTSCLNRPHSALRIRSI